MLGAATGMGFEDRECEVKFGGVEAVDTLELSQHCLFVCHINSIVEGLGSDKGAG